MADNMMNWSQVDKSDDRNQYIQCLNLVSGLSVIQASKQLTINLLELQAGDHVLDVGCGPGEDVLLLANIVGATGRAVGIDNSRSMIEEAQKRAENFEFPVEFRVADVMQLDFPADSFNGCRTNRVLMHLPDPEGAVLEMKRVLRTGGRLACFERDIETMALDSDDPETTRHIASYIIRAGFPNSRMGRQLPALFAKCGLTDIKIIPDTAILTDHALFEQIMEPVPAIKNAVADAVITQAQADNWLHEQSERGKTGRFFFAATGFAVCGTKG